MTYRIVGYAFLLMIWSSLLSVGDEVLSGRNPFQPIQSQPEFAAETSVPAAAVEAATSSPAPGIMPLVTPVVSNMLVGYPRSVILSKKGGCYALFGSELYSIGDTLSGFTIVAIHLESVVLSDGEATIEREIRDSNPVSDLQPRRSVQSQQFLNADAMKNYSTELLDIMQQIPSMQNGQPSDGLNSLLKPAFQFLMGQ
jgi:hypothetical protein